MFYLRSSLVNILGSVKNITMTRAILFKVCVINVVNADSPRVIIRLR